MASTKTTGRLIRFGLFELNTATRQLHKQGRRVRVQEQPLRVLEVLLERPGELVTRQELRQRLWPSDIYVDFEPGLNGAIKRLRLALGDAADNPRFVETVHKSGYRFIAPVQHVDPTAVSSIKPDGAVLAGDVASTQPGSTAVQASPLNLPTQAAQRATRPRGPSLAVGVLLAGAVMLAAYFLRPYTPTLQVTRIAKITHSGKAWPQESLFSDGARLYYTAYTVATGFQLRQILLNGNEDTPVTGLPANGLIRALSPDHTTFLAISQAEAEQGNPSPVWTIPVVGGLPRRVGDLQTNDFAWSPDGRSLAFARDNELFLAASDGTAKRRLAKVPDGGIILPRWSPDARRLRFTLIDAKGQFTIWEVQADGQDLHRLPLNQSSGAMYGFGEWTADGRSYVFLSWGEGVSNLWAIADQGDWLHRTRSEPVQLTAGPMSYYRPLPSRDGTQIFAIGMQPGGELLRYDVTQQEFVPFLGGRSADHLAFTRDGRWVTYVAYPEGTLWRAKSDGTQELQLTFPRLRALNPRWAPDGKHILFVGRQPGELPKLYTISSDGGNPEPLVSDPYAQANANWTPAGDAIIYESDHSDEKQENFIYRLDLRSGRTETVPGTEGLHSPVGSPDGRYLAARAGADHLGLILFDLKTGHRITITKGKADYPDWSPDSQYLYFNTIMGAKPAIYRVRVPGGVEEKITDVHFPTAGVYGKWTGLAPDGSLLILRNREQADVYALSLAKSGNLP